MQRLSAEQKARLDGWIRKAHRFWNAAEIAYKARDYETCASRAYYSWYHAAVALLMAHGHPDAERWRSHRTVISKCVTLGTKRNKWFVKLQMPGAGGFAESAESLYNLRLGADYGLEAVDREPARSALVFVDKFRFAVNEHVP